MDFLSRERRYFGTSCDLESYRDFFVLFLINHALRTGCGGCTFSLAFVLILLCLKVVNFVGSLGGKIYPLRHGLVELSFQGHVLILAASWLIDSCNEENTFEQPVAVFSRCYDPQNMIAIWMFIKCNFLIRNG